MQRIVTSSFIAILAAGSVLTSAAHARPGADGFLGGSIGSARVNGSEFDGDNEGYKFYLGSQGRLFGGEVGYVNFAELGGGDRAPDTDGYTLAITAGIPITPLFTPFAKAGLLFAETEGGSLERRIRDNEFYYGVGLRVNLLPMLSLRAEYERFEVARQDVDFVSAGVELRF